MTSKMQSDMDANVYSGSLSSLHDLFMRELVDMYCSEKAIVEAFPKMIEEATSDDLKDIFDDHLDISEVHIQRIEEIFLRLKISPTELRCEAIESLIRENESMTSSMAADPVMKEITLITGAQKIEHYEIAGYGSLYSLAKVLGYDEAAELLQATLEEESLADKKLTEMADVVASKQNQE